MQAFKLYYKIVFRKFLGVFIIYTIIFVGIISFFSKSGPNQVEDAFELSKVKISVINEDKSILANGLEHYINSISKPVSIKNDNQSIKDALFFNETEFVVIIPNGFQNQFTTSDTYKIQTLSVPDSISSEYAKTMIDRYLNIAKVYLLADSNMSVEEINDNVLNDMSTSTKVSFLDRTIGSDLSNLNMYFNFLSYILIAMLISMVGRIMFIFNNKEIKMRNYSAPISSSNYNLQLIFSNFLVAFVIWIVFVILAFIINDNLINQTSSLLFIINSLVLTIVCLSLSFLISTFVTKKSIDPIGNCVSLGLSFLGGAFVPQALLSDVLKTIGNFNPIFWNVKVNNTIGSISEANAPSFNPIIYGIFVQLAFAAAFLAIALVIIKQKRNSL